ncbi:peptidase M24, structural domain-containing protein [Chlamydoabsidia padenii]|nr:peptidase M24, structural domain-containing protein [Chlamydoabsidia padenii]
MLLRTLLVLGLLTGLAIGVWALQCGHSPSSSPSSQDHWKQALAELTQDATCVNDLGRVPGSQYIDRQARLAKTMRQEDVFAYVMEPSPTMLYYTNLTWSRTERAFLVLFTLTNSTTATGLDMTIITPLFEQTRAKEQWIKANLPSAIKPTMVAWVEHGSPFDTVHKVLEQHPDWSTSSTLQIEPTTRYFIAEGLRTTLQAKVALASPAIQQLRMIKTSEEIAIMRCANQITVRAIDTVQRHGIQVGMTEQAIESRMVEALQQVGLVNTWVVALVDANAAFPHGQPGQPHHVKPTSLVLIDTGGELYDYQSDTTRTFFLDPPAVNHTIRDAWMTVRNAQQAVLDHRKQGDSCANVDLTARHLITKAGFGHYFTHRLGHGIGLEMHEDPYMNQGNTDCTLQPGFTFSVEPGIYVPGEFGIRLEDIVVVNQHGDLELLTDGLALDPWA